MKKMNHLTWSILVTTSLVIGAVFLTSLDKRCNSGYWLWEDEFHVVQSIKETTFYEKHDFDFSMRLITKEDYIEASRPRPYKLVTVYKGVETEDFGDLKYLAKLKCKRYSDAIAKAERVITKQKLDKALAEAEENLIEKEIDSIESLECN